MYDAMQQMREQGVAGPLPTPVHMTMTFVLADRTRRDYDNMLASMKAGIDGLHDAGLLIDDSCEMLTLDLRTARGRASVRLDLEGSEQQKLL